MAKKVCPGCGAEEMEERKVKITRENGKVWEDKVYVCNVKSCGGVFIPQSIWGIGP